MEKIARHVFHALRLGAFLASLPALALAFADTPAAQASSCCERMAAAGAADAAPAADPGPPPVALPDRGKKSPLGEGWFVLDFDKKPSMGNVIARVEAFGKDGAPDTTLEVLGNVDMPSMRGAHSSGDRPFQLNKKGVYLLPMGIVMPGEWEIALTFKRAGKVIHRAYHRFKV